MRQMAGRKRRKRRMHRQRIRGIYTLLVMAAGGILIYSGQAGSGKKTEEYPAVSWIEAQEKENVKAIEAKLAAKDRATRTATTLFFRAGGMITARNMSKRATLKALTTRSGKMLPAMMPRDVPMDQPGMAMSMAP